MRSPVTILLFGLACTAGLFAQDSATTRVGPEGFSGSAHFGLPMPFTGSMVVSGAPYSAEEVYESVRTLADGTHITQQRQSTKTYRDSLGRTRTERPLFHAALTARHQENSSPTLVEITDPVAQVKYTLDPINKVAHRQALPAPPPPRRGAVKAALPRAGAAEELNPKRTSENLGTRTIEGVEAQGSRTTTIWPVDSQGNDRPFSVTNEQWFSSELKQNVLNISNDPRSGEQTQKLIDVSRAEPAANLFQPPPDYTVVDEKGDFTIKWEGQ